MIICHNYEFIFIKCRKTGSTSLEIALSEFCGQNDVITPISPIDEETRIELGFPSARNFFVPIRYYKPKDWARLAIKRRKKKYYNHMPAAELKSYVSSEIWKKYFKFCVERNPYDKLISHYYWSGGDTKYGTIENYLARKGYQELMGKKMYTIGNDKIVDYVVRYESLAQELSIISSVLKLPSPLKLTNIHAKSSFRKDERPYQEILSEHSRKQIESIFSWEIQHVGYKF